MSAFEIYAIASDLRKKEDEIQRATMLHCLGPAVQRIFNSLPGEHKSLEEVKTVLSGYGTLWQSATSSGRERKRRTSQ